MEMVMDLDVSRNDNNQSLYITNTCIKTSAISDWS